MGANTADEITFESGGDFNVPPLVLDTGYDTIPATGSSSHVIKSTIELRSNGNNVKGITVAGVLGGNPGIKITGDRNYIIAYVSNCSNGILIDGGKDNVIQSTQVKNNTTSGVEITGGATGNKVDGCQVYNNNFGVYIHGAGTKGNVVRGDIGDYYDSLKGNNVGVLISGGASYNTLSDVCGVHGSAMVGVLILDSGTDFNNIGCAVTNSGEEGIRIGTGASSNTIYRATVYAGTENGILINNNSNKNTIEWTTVKPTAGVVTKGAGIRILGTAGGEQPRATTIKNSIIEGGKAGLWVSGVDTLLSDAGTDLPPLTVTDTSIRNAALTGIVLDAGTKDVKILGVTSSGSPVGLEILGANTAYNTVDNTYSGRTISVTETGAWIYNGAHHNTLTNLDISYKGNTGNIEDVVGVAIETGANNNKIKCYIEGSGGKGNGIVVDGASYNTIAGVSRYNAGSGVIIRNASQFNRVAGLTAWSNAKNGIAIQGTDTKNNFIGEVDVFGNGVIGGSRVGILVEGASDTMIGDPLFGDTAIIEETKDAGIWVTAGASGIQVANTKVISSQKYGILVDNGAHDVVIGDDSKGGRNLVGFNSDAGILISGATTKSVTLVNNFVGVDIWGAPGANGTGIAVADGASEIYIGGSLPFYSNIVSGNKGAGISIAGANTRAKIEKNIIGMSHDLTKAVPNVTGIELDQGASYLGVYSNTIRGNSGNGVLIQNGANHNLLHGNVIKDNKQNGAAVTGAATLCNEIRGNSITGNRGYGISLLTGGNNNIPAPVIDEVSIKGQRVQGYVPSGVPSGSVVDVYADADDEGEKYVGTDRVAGNRFYVRGLIPEGMKLHAVVTDPSGNTSQFGTYAPGAESKSRPKHLAFVSTRDGNQEIYLMEPGVVVPTRLTREASADYTPRLSPAQDKLLFVTERSGNPDIWSMSKDGSSPAAFISDPKPDYDPAWSPDSTRLAYVSERDGDAEISVDYAPGGASINELAYDDGTADGSFNLPKDFGVAVHFTAPTGVVASLSKIKFYINGNPAAFRWAILNWASDKPGTVITEGTTMPTATGWHTVDVGTVAVPADYAVAFYYLSNGAPLVGVDMTAPIDVRTQVYPVGAQWQPPETYIDCMIRAVHTSPYPKKLTENTAIDRYPAWSPDGSKLAFTSDRSGNMDIWVMNADGTNPQQLTNDPRADYQPAWSPDGTKLAFVSERDGNKEIYIMAANGSAVTRLTSNSVPDTDPAFNLDGRILFANDQGTGMEIYYMNQDGSGTTRLTESLGANTQPDAGIAASTSGSGITRSVKVQASSQLRARTGEDLQVTVGSITAMPGGGTVSLAVNLSNAQNLGNLAFDIIYDKSKLTLSATKQEAFLSNALVAINPENLPSLTGIIRFNWVKAAGFAGSGAIMTLTFQIASGVKGENLLMDLSSTAATDVAIVNIPVQGQDGTITVAAALKGDANDDSIINMQDVTKIERIIAQLDSQTPGADANLDSKINVLDVTKTERIIAKLD